jgi:RNA polymerase sigma-70 factor (ECF subfamily)
MDVADAVNRLPEKLRIPFLLKYLAEYKEAEVATILKIPKTTVKNRLSKARQELRSYLSDWEVMFK